jgi:uncharacterized protein YxeA
MKKVLAAVVAAAFSIGIAGTAMAAPAQVKQQHNQTTQIQSDKADQNKKKKKTAKKSTKKKQTTAKKGAKKAA